MKTDTQMLVLKLLQDRGPTSPSTIASVLQISPQMVHRRLKQLLLKGAIRKQSAAPKVLYFPVEQQKV